MDSHHKPLSMTSLCASLEAVVELHYFLLLYLCLLNVGQECSSSCICLPECKEILINPRVSSAFLIKKKNHDEEPKTPPEPRRILQHIEERAELPEITNPKNYLHRKFRIKFYNSRKPSLRLIIPYNRSTYSKLHHRDPPQLT